MKKKYSCHTCGEDIYVNIRKKDFRGPSKIAYRLMPTRSLGKSAKYPIKYKKCPSCGHVGKVVLTGRYEDYFPKE